MFEAGNEALAETQSTPDTYQAHTVEILFATAIILVLCVTLYLTFFDGQSAF